MKRRIFVCCSVIIFVYGCNGQRQKAPTLPDRPADIPATTCDGTPIEWNWEKQAAYNKGKLTLLKDSTGCVIGLVRKIR